MAFTVDERGELDSLLGGRSLNSMLGRWSQLVTTIERGYDDSIYEYTNDLSVRDRLEELCLEASPTLAAKIRDLLTPIDQLFATATQPATRPLSASDGDHPDWWTRVPKRRKGELDDDLREMGCIE